MLFCICYLTINHYVFIRKLKYSFKSEYEGVNYCEMIDSPVNVGIINPKIYLPLYLMGNRLDNIITHEKVHIERNDNLYKIIACFVLSIYWFNPFVIYLYYIFIQDMEKSCDDIVLSRNNIDKLDYANELLSFAKTYNIHQTSFFGGNIKLRIKNILSHKNNNLKANIPVVITLVIVIALSLFSFIKPISYKEDTLTIKSPVNNYVITCDVEEYENHKGIDLKDKYYNPFDVYSCMNGMVKNIVYSDENKYTVEIEHSNGYRSCYSGLQEVYIKKGEIINLDYPIGFIGKESDYKHLHFELIDDNGNYISNLADLIS